MSHILHDIVSKKDTDTRTWQVIAEDFLDKNALGGAVSTLQDMKATPPKCSALRQLVASDCKPAFLRFRTEG